MKKLSLVFVLGAVLLGCPDKSDPKPDPATAAKPGAASTASAASSAAPKAGGGW